MSIVFTITDKEIYDYIQRNKNAEFNNLVNDLKIDVDSIRRSIEFLKSESVILEELNKIDTFELTITGKQAISGKLIEELFCNVISNSNINISLLKELKINDLSSEDISLAFGIAKRNELINIVDGNIRLAIDYKEKILNLINDLKYIDTEQLSKVSQNQINEFIKRKLITKKQLISKNYIFNKIIEYKVAENSVLELTPTIIKSKHFSNLKFKEFDVSALPKQADVGRMHPLRDVINTIKTAYLEMGFSEMRGPYVETAFWPMDAMFISQDHPMRDIQDTFYLPISGDLPDKKLVKKVIEMHINGGKTGSTGHRYDWKESIATQLVLRPHTTAVTYRTFFALENKDQAKYFCVGKVFRNETTDSSHLPEFHQAEGFVIGKNIGLAELIGFITEFSKRLGLNKIKFKPTYNPYTEPSVEASVYFEKEKRWMEFINAGVFRREALEPYKIKNNVIAWGLGVERVAMILYQKPIKEIYGDECNLDWLRTYKIANKQL